MRKRFFITAIALFVMSFGVMAFAQTKYDLYVAGVQVTSDNASDIASTSANITGIVNYDYMTKTLTLENAVISTNEKNGIYNSGIEDLAIVLVGNNVIKTTDYNAIFAKKNTSITGDGTLSVNAEGYGVSGIYIYENTTVSIEDGAKVSTVGSWGVNGLGGEQGEKLVVADATLKATGNAYGSIADLAYLTMNGCRIFTPAGAAFNPSTHCVELNGVRVTSEVVIEPASEKYDLYVTGIRITSANAADIAAASENIEGNIKYDPNTKTLTLDNVTIKNPSMEKGIFNEGITDLKIILVGKNVITAPNFSAISLFANTTIGGSGTIELTDTISSAIYINDNTTLTITDGCTVNINTSMWGIRGKDGTKNEILVIKNANLKITGRDMQISHLADLKLEGSEVKQPAGAKFNPVTHRLELNGEKIKTDVVIAPLGTGTSMVTDGSQIKLWSDGGMLYIKSDTVSPLGVAVYGMLGNIVCEKVLSADLAINLPIGIYVVRVGNSLQKVIVR